MVTETKVGFPSPTGVNHYEYNIKGSYDLELYDCFRPLQGLTIMNAPFPFNASYTPLGKFPSPTGVNHYE